MIVWRKVDLCLCLFGWRVVCERSRHVCNESVCSDVEQREGSIGLVNDGFQTSFDYVEALSPLLSDACKHKKRVKVGSRETEGICSVGMIGRMLVKRPLNPWWKVAKHPG